MHDHIRRILVAIIVLVLLGESAHADQVLLKDGTSGKGLISRITPDSLYFRHFNNDYETALPLSAVASYAIDSNAVIDTIFIDSVALAPVSGPKIRQAQPGPGSIETAPIEYPAVPAGVTAFEIRQLGQNIEFEESYAVPFRKALPANSISDNPYPSGIKNKVFGYVSIGLGIIITGFTLSEYDAHTGDPSSLAFGPALIISAPVSIIVGRCRLKKHLRWERQNGHEYYDDNDGTFEGTLYAP